MFSHADLRIRAQQIEKDYPDKLGLRVHRSIELGGAGRPVRR